MLGFLASLAAPLVSGIFAKGENDAAHDETARRDSAAREDYATRLQTTVADAKAAGINPYFAISGGAGNSVPYIDAPMQSSRAFSNSFDRIADVVMGRTALDSLDKEVSKDVKAIERDVAKRGSVAPVSSGVGAGSGTNSPAQGPASSPIFRTVLSFPQSPQEGGGFKEGPLQTTTPTFRRGNFDLARDQPVPGAVDEVEPLVKWSESPTGLRTPYMEFDQAAQAIPFYAWREFKDAVAPRYGEPVPDPSLRTDDQILRDNIKRNNPNATEAEILRMIAQIKGN